jgi:hypothetical protein
MLLLFLLTNAGLVVCTHERSDLTDKLYAHLAERLEVPDWIVSSSLGSIIVSNHTW